MRRAKLYWKTGMPEKKVECILYDEQQSYDEFMRAKYKAGYRQIILTTSLMLELIKKLGELGYEIASVDIAEDNGFFSRDLKSLLNKNPTFAKHFIQTLGYVLPSVDMGDLLIQQVHMLKKFNDRKEATVTLNVTGVIVVDENIMSDMSASDRIMGLISEGVQNAYF